MARAYYSDVIADFIGLSEDAILGKLTAKYSFVNMQITLKNAWLAEIRIMKKALAAYCGRGKIYMEYDIPRLGRRIDVVAVIDHVVFVLEFKTGATDFSAHAVDQVYDYALDLKNFHKTSHDPVFVAPVLIATEAAAGEFSVSTTPRNDKLLSPINVNAEMLEDVISAVLSFAKGEKIDAEKWETGEYSPTPTIIEAATALYNNQSVEDILRKEAGGKNLRETMETVASIIKSARAKSRKIICFLTGVPGAGKTLVGLNIAARHNDKNSALYSVFLSGNNPLVNVLCEALTRDKYERARENGDTEITKGEIRREARTLIQNVHHFRDSFIGKVNIPHEHVALFDESQRAWNKKQTAHFMRRNKGISDFNQSEPEFLISCMDRHKDWAVIVCLVGEGQAISTGEAGIDGWIDALIDKFSHWHVYAAPDLEETALKKLRALPKVSMDDKLNLRVSMRSFRSEKISRLINQLLSMEIKEARQTLSGIGNYPIVLTRNLRRAKNWVLSQARGSERYGLIVSSQAQRLKPHAIDVRNRTNPIHWFLGKKDDVRSSYYLEDAATEFEVQGLEVDWACLTWDADFRYAPDGWNHWMFRGKRWNCIHKKENQIYHVNAYRVLLTRARQGMAIVVPEGDSDDLTRRRDYYDSTFDYLQKIGFQVI